MLIRWLVHNWMRQAVSQPIVEAAQKAMEKGVRDAVDTAQEQTQATDESSETGRQRGLPQPPPKVLLCFATSIEAGGVVDAMQNLSSLKGDYVEHRGQWQDQLISAVEVGEDPATIEMSISDVIEVTRPQWVVATGFASAMRDELKRGHLLIPNELVGETQDVLNVPVSFPEETFQASSPFHTGRLLSTRELLTSPDQRRELASRCAAVACDRESMAIARVCQQKKVKFLAAKLITEEVNDVYPPEILATLKQTTTAGTLGVAAGALFRRMSAIKDMWKLHESAVRASRKLAHYLGGVISQLPCSR